MPYGTKKIGIERLHLEQDAGKSIHDLDPDNTYVDLNRSGIALMEIVSKPDLRSPDEVSVYVKKLRSIMRYLGTCDGNMQEGSLRADVNVSVKKVGEEKFGTRCEIKNVNSIKFMQMAINYEARRQIELLENNKIVHQETRLFDTKKNETRSMRSKENAHDYRYFPDPDLLPLNLDKGLVEKIKKDLPELPDQKKDRFIKEYSLSLYEANLLVSEKEISNYFEEVVKSSDKKLSINWIVGDLFASLNEKNISISDSLVTAPKMIQLINFITTGVISGRTAKEVFEIIKTTGEEPKKIIERKNLQQKSDPKELDLIINKVLHSNKDKVEQFKSGKDKLFGFFCWSSNEGFSRKS